MTRRCGAMWWCNSEALVDNETIRHPELHQIDSDGVKWRYKTTHRERPTTRPSIIETHSLARARAFLCVCVLCVCVACTAMLLSVVLN